MNEQTIILLAVLAIVFAFFALANSFPDSSIRTSDAKRPQSNESPPALSNDLQETTVAYLRVVGGKINTEDLFSRAELSRLSDEQLLHAHKEIWEELKRRKNLL